MPILINVYIPTHETKTRGRAKSAKKQKENRWDAPVGLVQVEWPNDNGVGPQPETTVLSTSKTWINDRREMRPSWAFKTNL